MRKVTGFSKVDRWARQLHVQILEVVNAPNTIRQLAIPWKACPAGKERRARQRGREREREGG